MPDLNEGRSWHASVCFNNKYVYIFGGRLTANYQLTSTMERLEINLKDLKKKFIIEKTTFFGGKIEASSDSDDDEYK